MADIRTSDKLKWTKNGVIEVFCQFDYCFPAVKKLKQLIGPQWREFE